MATRVVTGKYLNIDDTPCYGTIEFTPSSNTIKRGTAIYMASTLIVHLNSAGVFTINLTTTDDPTLEPTWKWIVDEKIEGGKVWYLDVPAGGSPIDISTVIPSNPSLLLQTFEQMLNDLQYRVQALESE